MTIDQNEMPSIAALKLQVYALVECGKFGDALDAIRYFVERVINNQRSVGKVFASADLDKLCQYVGEVAAKNVGVDSCSIERRGTVILATELVKSGGHVELIKDIIRLKLIDGPFSILLTDIFDRVDDDVIASFSVTHGIAVEVARCQSSIERLEWMLKRLCSFAPTTLVLLTHNQDSVGIAAAHSNVADRVVFIHHGDHHLSLGVTCEDFIHVDPHNIGFFHCRDELGIKNNYYWPLTVNCDSLKPRSNSFLAEGHLVTCSSGRPEKFDASYYHYDYFKLIPVLLAATRGRHIHIGSLTADMEASLQHELMTQGVDPARFINIPWVPSVARALIEYNVDLYISSFPLGGGKATLEVMAAGVPLLMHQSYRSRYFGGEDLAYPNAWIWRNEAELFDIVSKIKEYDLTRHSLLARAHYDKFHSEQSLIDAADFSKIQNIEDVPKLRQYTPDGLQIFLDEAAEMAKVIDEQAKVIDEQAKVIDEQAKVIDEQAKEIDEIYASSSWKITKPLRTAKMLLKGARPIPNNATGHGIECYQVQVKSSLRDNRPRVVHVIGNFMTGGSSRLVVDLFEHLGPLYQQEVVTQFNPSPPNYIGIPIHEFKGIQSYITFLAYLRKFQPKLVHVHYWGSVDKVWYARMIKSAHAYGCKVVENINTPVEPYIDACVSRYVYVSDYVRNTFGMADRSSLTIYPGSNFHLFSRDAFQAIPDDCIGMVYRLDVDKLNENAIDVFIKVAQRRPQTKIIIVGGGAFLEPYKAAVIANKVESSFNFTGFVDYEKLPELYAQMSLFVAPVWKESFGQVSPFAMSMGIPVVGYNVGALAEIISDSSLLAPPDDSDALAKIIIDLLNDKQRRERIGQQNRELAHSLFSVESMIDSYAKLYKELVESK